MDIVIAEVKYPRADRLKGTSELAAYFGVGKSAVSNWRSRRHKNKFPEPVTTLQMGPVYDLDEVIRWYDAQPWSHRVDSAA